MLHELKPLWKVNTETFYRWNLFYTFVYLFLRRSAQHQFKLVIKWPQCMVGSFYSPDSSFESWWTVLTKILLVDHFACRYSQKLILAHLSEYLTEEFGHSMSYLPLDCYVDGLHGLLQTPRGSWAFPPPFLPSRRYANKSDDKTIHSYNIHTGLSPPFPPARFSSESFPLNIIYADKLWKAVIYVNEHIKILIICPRKQWCTCRGLLVK